MNICVLKDIKIDENRVALQPIQVKELVLLGHNIYVVHTALFGEHDE